MAKQQSKDISWLIRDKYNNRVDAKTLAKDIKRLKNKEPLDYVIGWKPFLGCRIDLSLRPLIPRPETEYWAEKAIIEINKKPEAKILDIFAGSGCVGIAVLKHCPSAKVVFAEKSASCARQIKINTKINKINSKNFRIIKSDLFKNIRGKYDFILANPPYIPSKTKLVKSVASYEPRSALFAGDDGLKIIKKFLATVANHLEPKGQIWMEFHYNQKKAIESLIKKLNYTKYSFQKDQSGRWRFLVISSA